MSINTLSYSGAIRIGSLSADPANPQNGMIYYNTSNDVLRAYTNGAWADVSSGSISLIGQALNENNVVIGDSSDLSASLDTSATGDILADSATGLTIKASAISNTHISASAAIALSKLAALTASRVVVTDGSGVITIASYAPGDVILKGGSVPFTADQSMGSNKITNLANPTSAQDAATKFYVDSASAGLDPKASVRAATTANLAADYDNGASGVGATLTETALTGALASQDGVALSPGDRLLVKNQTNAEENGIYTVTDLGGIASQYILTRATDQDGSPASEVSGGNFTFVEAGSTQAGKGFVVLFDGEIAVGTDDINWTQFSDTGAPAVASVNGQTGVVVLGTDDIAEGTAKYFTDERAQDAVGAALTDSATIDFTYHDGANTITAIVIDASITNAKVASGIDAVKIADGSVSNAEFQRLDGVTSAIQTQLDAKATKALDNLASVAINTSLISDTNNTDDLGSDSIEWKDAWAHRLAHNDASNPDLAISTTGNNGSIVATAHGTGKHDIKATKARRSESGASANFVEEQYFDALTLTASQTASVESSLTFAHASYEGLEVTYKIKEATTSRVRIGTLRVATNGTDTTVVDLFTETADCGVTWSVGINGANCEVKYTTTANNKTMRADVKRIKA